MNIFIPKNNSYFIKAVVSSIIASVFIYYRKLDYYKTLPRHKLWVSFFILIWSMCVFIEPLCLPLGLVVLNIFGEKHLFNQ